jgi:hypothetical protein
MGLSLITLNRKGGRGHLRELVRRCGLPLKTDGNHPTLIWAYSFIGVLLKLDRILRDWVHPS